MNAMLHELTLEEKATKPKTENINSQHKKCKEVQDDHYFEGGGMLSPSSILF